MPESNDVQQRTDDFLTVPVERPTTAVFLRRVPWQRFSPFDPERLSAAIELAGSFMAIANSIDDVEAAMNAVLDEAQKAASTEDPELVRYALMVFLTHHPKGAQVKIKPIEQRAPQSVLPSNPQLQVRERALPEAPTVAAPAAQP